MIKSKDVAHLSLSPAGRVAKRCTQSLRNAGVPRAKSLPHINLVAEGRSLKARCAAVLHGDLDNASPKHRAETARWPGGSISVEPASPTTASTVGSSSSVSSPVIFDPPCSDQWEEDEDHCHRLLAVAQSWLDFEQLFPHRCADSVQTTEQARRDFCHDLIQSFSPSRSLTPSLSHVDQRSSNLADSVALHSISSLHLSSLAPSATSLTGKTTVASTVPAEPARSPKFSDEESQHESDNFSFRFSQEEEWTPEVESRMQNAIDRLLSDAMKQLAIPVPNFSVQFPDDILADSVAHQTAANSRTSRSSASSLEDYDSSYSVDREDEAEEDDGLVSLSPASSSPACSTTLVIDAVTVPVSPVPFSPSSQMDDRTSDNEQDDAESMVEDIGHGIDNVWEELATYVPRLLTRIPEESLADEFVVEEEARSLLSFKHAISLLPTHGDTTEVGSIPESTTLDTRVPFAATAGKTLRRVRKFVDLKNPVTLPTLQSTSSIDTLCEAISVDEEDCQDRRIRRVPGCIDSDLRKAFGGPDVSIETSSSVSVVMECSLSGLGSCFSPEERQCLLDLEEGPKSSTKPPISPKPPDLYLRRKRQRWVVDLGKGFKVHTTTKSSTKPSIPPKPPDLYLRRKRQWWVVGLEEGPKVQTMTRSPTKPPIPPKPPDRYLSQKRRRRVAA